MEFEGTAGLDLKPIWASSKSYTLHERDSKRVEELRRAGAGLPLKAGSEHKLLQQLTVESCYTVLVKVRRVLYNLDGGVFPGVV